MALSNITFFGWEFAEKIGFIKPEFIDELWWFAAGIACFALIFSVVEVVLSVKRYQDSKSFVGNIFLAFFSLIFGLWTMSCTSLITDYLDISVEIADIVEYVLFMVGLVAFVGYVMNTFFDEISIISNALSIITACFAIAVVVMDTFGMMSLATGAFYMLVYVVVILAVLVVISLIRLFLTGKSKYVMYFVSLVVLVGLCTFNFFNQKSLFVEEALFDYRLVMLVYLLIIMIYGIEDTAKKTNEIEAVSLESQEMVTKVENAQIETTATAEVTTPLDISDSDEPEIEVTDLSEMERPMVQIEPVDVAGPVGVEKESTPATTEKEEKKAPKKPSYSPHYTDFLTELRNRIFFMEQLTEIQNSENYEKNIAVVVFDVDGLNQINETYGYAIGDQVLRLAATAISTSFEDVGDCARIDGDGFAVIVKDSKPGVISQRLLVMLEAIKNYNEKADVKVSISFGYAVYSGKGDLNMEALLRMAEKRTEEKRR